MSSCPEDLVSVLREVCSAKKASQSFQPPPMPADDVIRTLLDISYHASFETEEGRRPGFRLILYSPGDHNERWGAERQNRGYYDQSFRLILLDSERPFNVAEVHRLAPAAEFKRLLICVRNTERKSVLSSLHIWAPLDIGESWWKFVHHETSGGMPPPNF